MTLSDREWRLLNEGLDDDDREQDSGASVDIDLEAVKEDPESFYAKVRYGATESGDGSAFIKGWVIVDSFPGTSIVSYDVFREHREKRDGVHHDSVKRKKVRADLVTSIDIRPAELPLEDDE